MYEITTVLLDFPEIDEEASTADAAENAEKTIPGETEIETETATDTALNEESTVSDDALIVSETPNVEEENTASPTVKEPSPTTADDNNDQ